mmetsp:Transcript_2339/g.5371  ORF Transcript_2339/g.5371 Transcript_2339/m.5371 type:complete len:238 (-) Transcript_2339:93-806(-)
MPQSAPRERRLLNDGLDRVVCRHYPHGSAKHEEAKLLGVPRMECVDGPQRELLCRACTHFVATASNCEPGPRMYSPCSLECRVPDLGHLGHQSLKLRKSCQFVLGIAQVHDRCQVDSANPHIKAQIAILARRATHEPGVPEPVAQPDLQQCVEGLVHGHGHPSNAIQQVTQHAFDLRARSAPTHGAQVSAHARSRAATSQPAPSAAICACAAMASTPSRPASSPAPACRLCAASTPE